VRETPPTLTLPLKGGGEVHGIATKSPSPSKGEGGVGVTRGFMEVGYKFHPGDGRNARAGGRRMTWRERE